jgi:branched-chain amino acid aminotransferase
MAGYINIPEEPVQLYEVIRITEGIPLFLEDHLDRLTQSALLTGITSLPDQQSLNALIKYFLATKKSETGNIKLSFLFRDLLSEPQYELNFIPHYYPASEEYTCGVRAGLLKADRPVPNAKVSHSEIRDRADRLIAKENIFEALLVDSDGNITEGSRSNLFFVRDETLYTAPGEKILQGITWKKILQICSKAGIPVIEKEIPAERIDQFEAAFLTGTSPKVLPISSVEKVVYQSDHPIVTLLMELYDQLIAGYLSMHLISDY